MDVKSGIYITMG